MPEALNINHEEQIQRSSQLRKERGVGRNTAGQENSGRQGKSLNIRRIVKGREVFNSLSTARRERTADSYLSTAKAGLELAGMVENKQQEDGGDLSEEEQFSARKELLKLVAAAESSNKFKAYKEAAKIGLDFREQINKNKLSGGTFWAIMLLSIIGDAIDLLTLGTIGYIADKVIAIVLFFIFFLQVSFIKKWLIKRYAWPVIIKFIPFINFFPSYTISAILLKLKIDKKNKQLSEQAEQVEKDYKNYNPKVIYE